MRHIYLALLLLAACAMAAPYSLVVEGRHDLTWLLAEAAGHIAADAADVCGKCVSRFDYDSCVAERVREGLLITGDGYRPTLDACGVSLPPGVAALSLEHVVLSGRHCRDDAPMFNDSAFAGHLRIADAIVVDYRASAMVDVELAVGADGALFLSDIAVVNSTFGTMLRALYLPNTTMLSVAMLESSCVTQYCFVTGTDNHAPDAMVLQKNVCHGCQPYDAMPPQLPLRRQSTDKFYVF